MSRVAVLVAVLSLLPPACAKLMGEAPPPAAPDVAPPPVPITSATTPPAWHPPDPTASPSVASASPPPLASPDLVKARAAADAKDFKKVRSLLEKKVRGGKCAPEESLLVLRACTALKDKACVAEVRARHGEELTE